MKTFKISRTEMFSVESSAALKCVLYKLKNPMRYKVIFYCSIFLNIDNVSNSGQWKKWSRYFLNPSPVRQSDARPTKLYLSMGLGQKQDLTISIVTRVRAALFPPPLNKVLSSFYRESRMTSTTLTWGKQKFFSELRDHSYQTTL